MTITTYQVDGMTCGHCVAAVTAELNALDEVSSVTVELVPGGTSAVAVTASTSLTSAQVSAALDEAGNYHLAETSQ
jgi:copper chaperone CopZ